MVADYAIKGLIFMSRKILEVSKYFLKDQTINETTTGSISNFISCDEVYFLVEWINPNSLNATFKLEISNDGENWTELSSSVPPITNLINRIELKFNGCTFDYIRYTLTINSGSADFTILGKGITTII